MAPGSLLVDHTTASARWLSGWALFRRESCWLFGRAGVGRSGWGGKWRAHGDGRR